MRRIFVQGDRDAKGIEAQVRELGALCKERGIGLNVGERGEIVNILTQTGADVRVHYFKEGGELNVPDVSNVHVVDCVRPAVLATEHLRQWSRAVVSVDRVGWGIRLSVLEQTSDGFVFFPGREGTLAHLIPILAFIAKGERDKERPCRRVALVGWKRADSDVVKSLFGPDGMNGIIWAFPLTSVVQALGWTIGGFPSEDR